ncbi:MAG: hypothetical protein U0176_05260 [Bacteroidia bacterium]
MTCSALWAQTEFTTADPVEYSNYIVTEQEKIGAEFIDFSNLLLSSNDYKTNEAKRLEVVKLVELGLRRLRNMAPFKDGGQLRNESIAVFEAYRDLHLNEYAKITLLVSNKESSLTALEDYFQMQIKAEKKMMEYAVRLKNAQKKFAESYKLTLLHNPMQDQFDRILECNVYSREVFLAYIAVAKLNEAWWEAMDKNDFEAMEKNRLAIMDAASKTALASMQGFHGDGSFRDVAKERVDYFARLAGDQYKEFSKILQNPQRTKEDIDYINGEIDAYNDKNMKLNDKFNTVHRDLKLRALPAPSGGK